jgi:hypothetical protein
MVLRLVGFTEYGRALNLLHPLAEQASPEEREVIDRIVATRDEITVHTNHSRRVESAPSTLSEPPAAPGTFAKRGLDWVTALARVELGAMAAGFTDADEPFEAVPPGRSDVQSYAEVLLDSTRMHFFALRNDPVAQYYWSQRDNQVTLGQRSSPSVNEQQAIAYARRVMIADEFVQASAKLGAGRLTPPQAAELGRWHDDLQELEDAILYKVLGLGEFAASGASATTRKLAGRWQACPRLLKKAQSELASGRAVITTRRLGAGAQSGGGTDD